RAQADTTRSPGRLFYDITAWSLPYSYDLEAYELTETVATSALTPVTSDVVAGGEVLQPNASNGFVIDYSNNPAIGAIARLRREGIPYRTAREPLTLAGRRLPAGSAVVLRSDNPDRDLNALARSLARESGATIVGVTDSPPRDSALIRAK